MGEDEIACKAIKKLLSKNKMSRFMYKFVSRDLQFSFGIDCETGKYFISFMCPTSNRRSDYEVYYFFSEKLMAIEKFNPIILNYYFDQCRSGLHENERVKIN